MPLIPLEQRGIRTNRLILGCMSFGGNAREPITKEDILAAEQAIDAAQTIGISMFDHADIYAMGKAEETFGAILKARPAWRDQIILQSKCGIRLGDGSDPKRFDFSKTYILESVDGILNRLNTEYLDVLLLHRPDPLVVLDEVAEALGRLKSSGKVRYFGVSNMRTTQIRFLQQAFPDQIITNQIEMSLGHLNWLDHGIQFNRADEAANFSDGLLEYCQMEHIQLQAWSPLARGRFSGRDVLNEPEHIQKTADRVKRMADEKETTAEAIVLGWLIRHPAMIQPVIGTTNVDRIKACGEAERQAELMTREEWYALYVSARGASVS